MEFKIIEILEPITDHCIGNPTPVRLLWIKKRTANHRPWRWYYYRIRNRLFVFVNISGRFQPGPFSAALEHESRDVGASV
jgi:hypothetical protein